MKRCRICGETKPLSDFYAMRGMRDGHRNECKACHAAARAARYRADPAKEIARVRKWQQDNSERLSEYRRNRRNRGDVKAQERSTYLRRKYGLTLEEYEALLEAQGGCCAICRREPNPNISLHVDHDHETGQVRRLLCVRCNNGVALFEEDPSILRAAAVYLDEHDPDVDELTVLIRERAGSLVSGAR